MFTLRELRLDTVDAVDGIDEQDQDEDEGNLKTVLYLSHNCARRNPGEKPHPWGVRDRQDHEKVDCHLYHEQDKYQRIVKRHDGLVMKKRLGGFFSVNFIQCTVTCALVVQRGYRVKQLKRQIGRAHV